LRNWIRQDETDHGERDDRPSTSELEELRRLRKENSELKRANEVLKAASALFRVGARPDPATVMTLVQQLRDPLRGRADPPGTAGAFLASAATSSIAWASAK
jgi:transposase-like protein